jgi:hypothetical protein
MPNDTVEVRAQRGGVVACLYRENWPHGADEANAKAIAAVPAMVEALLAVGPVFDVILSRDLFPKDDPSDAIAFTKVMEALKLAGIEP